MTGTKGLEIVRLALAGVSREEIEARTGSSRRSVQVILSNARKNGIPVPKAPNGKKPWRRQQVAELIHLSPKRMAEVVGISEQNILVQLAKLRKDGVDIPYRRPPSAKFRAAMANRKGRDWDSKLTERWTDR